ncbi:hypothetical protein LY90DRAFT_500418 [Neocallimastix californiae]|uniref:SH3 domain-containing protein n=1 Tax=Neocallimastix californiae TaxID=1754190 RepID=A0A1Y2FCQ7_9FUNG|nr:hypothetical protein LY90DRAFT_500418 [Neocallimastix californiae]|eukprot:ORY80635.1 hypothetical protein LY90DRAFT_500418 [Neocallimastix californiae]
MPKLDEVQHEYDGDNNYEIVKDIIESCTNATAKQDDKEETLKDLEDSLSILHHKICEIDASNDKSENNINESINNNTKNHDNESYTESDEIQPTTTSSRSLPPKIPQTKTPSVLPTNLPPKHPPFEEKMDQSSEPNITKREDNSNKLETLDDFRNFIEKIEKSAKEDYKDYYNNNSEVNKKLEYYKTLGCHHNNQKSEFENIKSNGNPNDSPKSTNGTLKNGLICGGIGLIVVLIIVLLVLVKKGKRNKKNSETINVTLQADDDDDIKIVPVKPNNIQKTTLKSEPVPLNKPHQEVLSDNKDNSNSSFASLNSQNINQSANTSVVATNDIINNNSNSSFTSSPKLQNVNPINGTKILNNIRSDSPMMRNAVPEYVSNVVPSPPLQSSQLPSAPMATPPMYSPHMHFQSMQSPVIQSQPTPINYNNINNKNENNYTYRNSPVLENSVNGNIPADNYQNSYSGNNSGYQIPSPPIVPIASSLVSNENSRNSISSVSTLQNKGNAEVIQETNKGTLPSYIDTISKKVQPNEHVFVAQYYYNPQFNDEFQISPGDVISFGQGTYDDGWAHGKNLTKDTTGVFPLGVVIKVVDVNGNNRDPYQLSEKYRCKPRSSSHTVKYQASTSENDPKFIIN